MYDVSILKLTGLCQVLSGIGYRHLEQVLPVKAVAQPDDKAFKQKIPFILQPRTRMRHMHGRLVRRVTNQHLSLYPIAYESLCQSVGSHSSPTRLFACIYD